jgi:plastocyanin
MSERHTDGPGRKHLRTATVLLGLLLFMLCGSARALALGSDSTSDEISTVTIHARQFTPDRTVVHQGKKTSLIFKNQDTELHSIVPFKLLTGEDFNILGNGAPEFGADGFKRVIIPPDGVAEIHFTPAKTGEYRYICDMPGHEMKAVIVVE